MYIPTAAARYLKAMCGCTVHVFVENDRSTIPLFKKFYPNSLNYLTGKFGRMERDPSSEERRKKVRHKVA
jgi:hypothetical protein